MKKSESLIIYFIAILGILLIGFSIYFFSKSWIFKSKAIKTTGKVIDVYSRLGGKNKIKEYARVIIFTTETGEKLQFQSQTFTLSQPEMGENINVYYTLNPTHAVEEKFISLWGLPLGIFAVGIGLLAFSMIYYKRLNH